jgi:hypothetical protein
VNGATPLYGTQELERGLNHFLSEVCPGQVNIFQGCLLFLVPHQSLKGRNSHVFVGLMGTEGVPKR